MDHHVDVDLTQIGANVPNGVATFARWAEPVVHHDFKILRRLARQAYEAFASKCQPQGARGEHGSPTELR
jgi:hypothetical protein